MQIPRVICPFEKCLKKKSISQKGLRDNDALFIVGDPSSNPRLFLRTWGTYLSVSEEEDHTSSHKNNLIKLVFNFPKYLFFMSEYGINFKVHVIIVQLSMMRWIQH